LSTSTIRAKKRCTASSQQTLEYPDSE
jgi:hypothetical protein